MTGATNHHRAHRNGDDVTDMIAELVRPHQHREVYTQDAHGPAGYRITQGHTTRVPSLLDQLVHATPSGTGGGRSGAYESRPAARVEALSVWISIDTDAARWVRNLGLDDPGDPARCVTLVGSLHVSARTCDLGRPKSGCCPRHDIEHDVRSWWTQARIVAGWDTPPYRPDVTCPVCTKRGGLRIRLEDRVGMCAECHTTWSPGDYQQLAEHVRQESEARSGRTAEPCWCPWPTPVDRIDQLCRTCGSARCHRAVTANLEKHAPAS